MTGVEPIFRDRCDAGRRLAALLEDYRGAAPVIVAMPRGGVPVAAEVARALDAPLDIVAVRKVGAPRNPEFAIGAVAEGEVRVIGERAVRGAGISSAELEMLVAQSEAELAEQALLLRGAEQPLALPERTVILVDDGLATGRSALAATESLRRRGAGAVILAVPVAARSSLVALASAADAIVAVEQPLDLWAVGSWYEDFRAVSDEAVAGLLARWASARARRLADCDGQRERRGEDR